VLACGPGAALSHVSAGALLGVRETVSVLLDGTARTRASLDEALRRHPGRRAIPLLTEQLERHLPGIQRTRSELERVFVRLISEHHIDPSPLINANMAGYEVDALWPAHRLAVELDSLEFHRTRAAMRRDYDKALALTAAGLHVVRLDWEQVTTGADRTAQTLQRLLAGRQEPQGCGSPHGDGASPSRPVPSSRPARCHGEVRRAAGGAGGGAVSRRKRSIAAATAAASSGVADGAMSSRRGRRFGTGAAR
jgi:very-short-patch-repair endonuclease